MPRLSIYAAGFLLLLASLALTLTSIALPNWISYSSGRLPHLPNVPPPRDQDDEARVSYGLHSRCSTLEHPHCRPFPIQRQDCIGSSEEESFCAMWRSVGFLMNFAVVVQLAAIVGFVVVLVGGRQKREGGWKMVSGLVGGVAVVQLAAMSIVAYLRDHDVRFEVGWSLDTGTVLCTLSWVVLAITAAGTVAAAYVMPPEDDYETIP